MKQLLTLAAVIEAATGLALTVAPSLVAKDLSHAACQAIPRAQEMHSNSQLLGSAPWHEARTF